jgi:FtsZ-binding cell division protein ZapB
MDAQLVARKLNEAFSNDDLWTSPSIVDAVEDLAYEYDALKAENANLREYVDRLERHALANVPTSGQEETKAWLNHMRRMCWLEERW